MEEMKVRGKLTWVSPIRTWTGKNGRAGGSCTVKIDVDDGRYTDDFCGDISDVEAGYMKKQGIRMGDTVELTFRVSAYYNEKNEAWFPKVRVKTVELVKGDDPRTDDAAAVKSFRKQAEEGDDLPF